MKKERFSEEQIIQILEEGKLGNIDELCRKHGIAKLMLSLEIQILRNDSL